MSLTGHDRSTKTKPSRAKLRNLFLAALIAAAGWVGNSIWDSATTNQNAPEAERITETSVDGPFSDLPIISSFQLPPEAIETLELIDSNGPFPFKRDGLVFQNREGILPDKKSGHYHEFTVITPGENDRGARRIVTGSEGELYYTEDHYNSFREIVDWQMGETNR